MIYVNDCIVFSKQRSVINGFIQSLQSGKEKYILTNKGEIYKYIGVDIINTYNDITMKQPYMVEHCLQEMGFVDEMSIKKLLATKYVLHKDKEGYPRQYS